MNNQIQPTGNDAAQVTKDASALMAATADVAGEKVEVAHKRLSIALERARKIAVSVRDQAVAGTKAIDQTVREHPYETIAIGVGVGALIGYLIACRRNRD